MSTQNICFRGEIRKILTRYPPYSRPMILAANSEGPSQTAQMHSLIWAFTFSACAKGTFWLGVAQHRLTVCSGEYEEKNFTVQ